MDFVFVLIGLSTMFLFMYKIEWLFIPKFFVINIVYDLILFLIYMYLLSNNIDHLKMVAALKMPLFSSIIFFILYVVFKKIFRRNPENTFWMFTKKPVQDIIFTILFWFLGVGCPFFLIK